MADPVQRSYRCPECKEPDTLYENVDLEGWQSVDAKLSPTGEHEADWMTAVTGGSYGCSCGWTGSRSKLEPLGIDGEPLVAIHPDQQTLGVS